MNMGISGFTVQSEHLVAFFALLGIYLLIIYFDKKSYYLIALSGLFFSFILTHHFSFIPLFVHLFVYYLP